MAQIDLWHVPQSWLPWLRICQSTHFSEVNKYLRLEVLGHSQLVLFLAVQNSSVGDLHPASHVTLWLSSGKFASGSDFKGGAFFLKGGAFFVGILPPLIFREMMQKPTPFFCPP